MNSIIILGITGIIILTAGLFNYRKWVLPIALLGCVISFITNLLYWNSSKSYFNNMLFMNNYAVAFSGILIFLTILVFLICSFYYKKEIEHLADIFSLIIFSLSGALIMVSYANLVMFFMGIEILSIPLYILSASNRKDLLSNEAGLKYFILGSFATTFVVMGIALIYGVSNTFDIHILQEFVSINYDKLPNLFILGVLLLFVGFTFKISAAPFHFWAPDVYQGSPTVISTFMASVVKTAALASLLRLATTSLAPIHEKWFYTLAAFSVLTLFIGTLSAIYQQNFKRFLAYSGIANAGFLLIPIITISNTSSQTMLYYTLAYSLGTIAAFSAFIITKEYTDKYEIDSIRGLYKNNPLLTITIIISMFSLAGIPPLAGFFAKYYLIMNAMEHKYYILAIIAIIASLIAIYYYLKIVTNIFSKESNIEKIPLSFADRSVLIICIVSLIGLGLFPSLIFDLL